jgi:hypothetical protein
MCGKWNPISVVYLQANLVQAFHVSRQVHHMLHQLVDEWNTMLLHTGVGRLPKNQKMKCDSNLYHTEEGLLRNLDKVLPRLKDLVKLLESEVG